MMDRTPKFLGLFVAIIMVVVAFLLPSSGILAQTDADPGTITIIDTENQSGSLTNFEYQLDSPGNPSWLMAWGSQGSGDGQFEWTKTGMDVDSNGNVYVADELNHRVQKFNSDGELVLAWGSGVNGGAGYETCTSSCQAGVPGTGEGEFDSPSDLVLNGPGSYVYVIDTNNHRIQMFNSSGSFVAAWGWGVDTGANEYETCANGCQGGIAGTGDGQFDTPSGIGLGSASVLQSGSIYVADGGNNRIQYFDSDGEFQGKWGATGTAEAQFNSPSGVTVDRSGNVIVADSLNYRVQKFTGEGEFNRLWGWGVATGASNLEVCTVGCLPGISGSGEGQFTEPLDVDVDNMENVYVAGLSNYLQKFSPGGSFINQWGGYGTGDGQFDGLGAIALDRAGNVFAADVGNYRLQKFVASTFVLNIANENYDFIPDRLTFEVPAGTYTITEFYTLTFYKLPEISCSSSGDAPVINSPSITINLDPGENVTCTYYNVMEQGEINFTKESNPEDGTDFEFLWGDWDLPDSYSTWGEAGSRDSQFNIPTGIASDRFGNVYVVDRDNNRVQKFDSEGTFQSTWGWGVSDGSNSYQVCTADCRAGSYGNGNGQFDHPQGITVDSSNQVYVVDTNNNRVQKFDNSGNYITQWGSPGASDGQFNNPNWVTTDSADNVYVVDHGNNRIQKFDSSGAHLLSWGGAGTFPSPQGIAASNADLVYVLDSANNNVQVFDLDGNPQTSWGGSGTGEGQFNAPTGIVADGEGDIFVADRGNDRIQKFAGDGTFLSTWGSTGSFQELMNQPTGISVNRNGYVFVTEQFNQRVNEFRATILTLDDEGEENDDDDVDHSVRFQGNTGSYKITELGPDEGWTLKSITCDTNDTGDDPVIEIPSAYFNLDAGESIDCVFYNTIYEEPVADFSADPVDGIAPIDVQFTNLSTGDFTTCDWDFGDGNTSDVCEDPLHTYTETGVYTVSLALVGPEGESTETKTDYITVHDPTYAEFSGTPTIGGKPLEVSFTNLSEGDFDECEWDFGDGGTNESCDDPIYLFEESGPFTVTLTISGTGGIATEIKPEYITVLDGPYAEFSADPTEGIGPLDVQFTNMSTGVFDTCSWDFGDTETSDDCGDPLHTYEAGVYTVSLTVEGPDGEYTQTKTDYITVYGAVMADFSAEPSEGIPPLDVTFTNLSEGDYDTCSWDFGDGTTSEECEIVDPHTYDEIGYYTVSLTVGGLGGEDTETKTDYIGVFTPSAADFSADPTEGIAPLDVQFTNLSSGDYDTCSWDFGDGGNSSSCGNPSHNYTTPGTYTVELTVSGVGGEDTETKTNYISVYEQVVADFSADPTIGTPPVDVSFTNLSTGDFDTCEWDFGDGGTSNDCNDPVHTYTTGGSYAVSLTVSGLGGEDTETKTDYIYTYVPPTSDFSADPTFGVAPLDVDFTNLTTGDYDTCSWDFGDGETSDDCDLAGPHTYDDPGVYTVSLYTSGPAGEDTLTRTDYIIVYTPAAADFSADTTEGMVPLYVTFTNLSSGDFDTCHWDFGDGTTHDSCGKLSYRYQEAGRYTVSLTVEGNGGEDTETKVEYIVVLPYYYNYMPVIMGGQQAPENTGFIQSVIDFFTDLLP